MMRPEAPKQQTWWLRRRAPADFEVLLDRKHCTPTRRGGTRSARGRSRSRSASSRLRMRAGLRRSRACMWPSRAPSTPVGGTACAPRDNTRQPPARAHGHQHAPEIARLTQPAEVRRPDGARGREPSHPAGGRSAGRAGHPSVCTDGPRLSRDSTCGLVQSAMLQNRPASRHILHLYRPEVTEDLGHTRAFLLFGSHLPCAVGRHGDRSGPVLIAECYRLRHVMAAAVAGNNQAQAGARTKEHRVRGAEAQRGATQRNESQNEKRARSEEPRQLPRRPAGPPTRPSARPQERSGA